MADGHDISKHVKAYVAVFVALAVFTVVTIVVAQIHIQPPWNVVVALLIATVKATLVVVIFMHLKWDRFISIWAVLGLCAVFFVVLMLLPVLIANDLPPQVHHGIWG